MRKIWVFLLLGTLPFLLCGCQNAAQVEDLAFAEVLGVDLDGEEITVCVEIPKISGERGDSGSDSEEGSSNLIYSASGKSFDEALNLLNWAVPRRLDLSQIKLIVVSESLARSDRFQRVADTIMSTPRLYTAARLSVCSGSAKAFVAAEKPVIGTRLASELTATFEDYIRSGYIPESTFADLYYRSNSIYSDCLSIYAETSPESAPASAIIPENPQQSNVEMQHSNRYLGAAVFQNGRMLGRLSGDEFLYCKMLQGEQQTFALELSGQTVGLTTMGTPSIEIDMSANPIRIEIDLQFSIVSSSKSAPRDELESALENSFMNVIEACRQMNAEPFGLAEKAAAQFLTLREWENFNWLEQFLSSDIRVNVRLQNVKE